MRKFWQTKKFKALQNKWEKKLLESGFVDAEKMFYGSLHLKQPVCNYVYRYNMFVEAVRENRQLYFELLGEFFHKEQFNDEVERLIMERRAEGVKIKHICEELKSLKERCHRQTVRLIIRKYEIKWGIRKT